MKIAIDDANVQAAVDDAVEMHAATSNSVENDSRMYGDVANAVDAMIDEVHHDDLLGVDVDGDGVPDIDIDGDGIPDFDVDGTPLHNLDDEEAMVEAAKRAGEAAADAEMAAAADVAEMAASEAVDAAVAAEAVISAAADEAVAAARAEAAEANDRLLRLQADWENYRRRTAAERIAERERAAEDLVVSLLPVLDDMERASSHASADDACAEGSAFAQFVAGVDAVHDKMVGILARAGVSVIDPAGEAFDPLEAQAVGRVEDSEAYADTVVDVYQRGYRMGGKVIRTAMVTVSYGGPTRPTEDDHDE